MDLPITTFLLQGILIVLLVMAVNVIIHELGHAIPSLLFTKQPVKIFIGSFEYKSKSFKIKDSHVTGNTTVLSQSIPAILPVPAYLTAVNILTEQAHLTGSQANAPPGNPAIPIYTLNCAYRI